MKTWMKYLLAGMAGLFLLSPIKAEAASLSLCGGIDQMMELPDTTEELLRVAKEAQGALWGYTKLGICDVESGNLNVRKEPSTSSKIVGKMRRNDAAEILEETEDGWLHIQSGEVEGYVKSDYVLTGPKATARGNEIIGTVAIANVSGLNVRATMDTKGAVITQIAKGEEIEYIETIGDWVKIDLDGEEAYVAAQYVTLETKLSTAITMTELLYGEGVSDVRIELVEYAKQFVGNPYVWGGTSLTKGADCSGFVLSVYKKFGIKVSHSSRAQAVEGTKISYSDLLPGDLVFYGSPTISHVAIYIGGGKVVHAASPKQGIIISKYNYHTPVKYARFIQD